MSHTQTGWEQKLNCLVKKRTGLLLICRELGAKALFEERMINILDHLKDSLDLPDSVSAWTELDGRTYGRRSDRRQEDVSVENIMVGDALRGRICVSSSENSDQLTEREGFLREVAELIGRELERRDHEEALRESEGKFRKLAGNLAKEMWNRTEALAKERGYLEGILRSSDDMIITTDLSSLIVEFNPAAEEILGYKAEEVQGQEVTVLWENADERGSIFNRLTGAHGVRNHETRLKTKDGELRDISLTLSLLKDEEGRTLGTVGISKDITRENAIRRELERLNQNYRETIHFISHESKNSLIVIGGFVRRLLETESDPARKEQLQIVYHHSKFLEAMSKDFLVMAELEHGEFRIRKQEITNFYREVILPAMIGLKERYPDSFETYDTTMGGVGPVRVSGDPGLLEIVYRNLFGNALKYRYPGGKISYGVEERADCLVFNVWNEGPGVLPDHAEKIFEKFYRADDEATRAKKGTGLGLYNIRQIITAHGGCIWCESRPGSWINFLFTLPKE